MKFQSCKLQEAIKNLTQKLVELLDTATVIKQCESFIQLASKYNANFESCDIQQRYDVLFEEGQCLLKECDRLIEICNQDHGQCNRSAINNNMQRLTERINQYRMKVESFKFTVRAFTSKLREDVTTAKRNVRQGNNTQIVSGVGVSGSVLTLLVGTFVGGPLGGVIAVGSIIYGGISVKKGVKARNVAKDVVKIKDDYEKTLSNTEESYRQLCEQHAEVEKSFRRCEQLVEDY